MELPPVRDRIGACSWSLGVAGPGELCASLERLGLSVVQLALNPLLNDPATWGGTVQRLRDAGITVASGMMAMVGEDYSTLESIARTGGVRPDATWPDNLRLATRIADLAAANAIRLVTFHAGFISESQTDPERDMMLDRLHIVADAFQARNVRLALETGQETAGALVRVLEQLCRPLIGVNFDPANMILYGKGDPVQGLRLLRPHVRQIHVKDAVPSNTPGGWGTEVAVGEGAVNWKSFFVVAETIDPPVKYIIEREDGADRLEDVRAAAERIRAGLSGGRA